MPLFQSGFLGEGQDGRDPRPHRQGKRFSDFRCQVSNYQAATAPPCAAPWTHQPRSELPGSSLLVLFLSKLLITHYLYVSRLIDRRLRDQ